MVLDTLPQAFHNSSLEFWPIPSDRTSVTEWSLLGALLAHTFFISTHKLSLGSTVYQGFMMATPKKPILNVFISYVTVFWLFFIHIHIIHHWKAKVIQIPLMYVNQRYNIKLSQNNTESEILSNSLFSEPAHSVAKHPHTSQLRWCP